MALPSGLVTFAFTDVVGSTRALAAFGDAYASSLRQVHEVVASRAGAHGGAVVSVEGDGAFLAFPDAGAAVQALCEVQEQVAVLGCDPRLEVRAGAHTGDAIPVAGDYVSLAVHVAARVSATAGAGQVIVSQAVIDAIPEPRGERLGAFQLKDVPEPTTLWRVAGPPVPVSALPARRTNVAVPRTSFVGREQALQELFQLAEKARVVTILGPGGLGKTRLASEFCLSIREQVAGGAWLVELAKAEPGDEVGGVVAAVLGLAGDTGVRALAAELRRRGEVVLVLDNCEHVVAAAAALVDALLPECPELMLLCTSRVPLEVDGENVLRLHPLHIRGSGGAPGPAELLFMERSASLGVACAADDADAVSRICGLLDGLPLAIELAAAQSAVMPLTELTLRLAEGSVRLRRRGGDLRQQSLEELIAWSVRLLTPEERRALLVLAVLPARFEPSVARAILNRVPYTHADAAAVLARQSLLDLDGGTYRMLVTIREVARRELGRDTELHAEARRALVDWARDFALERDAQVDKPVLSDDLALTLEEALDAGFALEERDLGRVMEALISWVHANQLTSRMKRLAEEVVATPIPDGTDPEALRLWAAAHNVLSGLAGGPGDTEALLQLLEGASLIGGPLEATVRLLAGKALDRSGRFEQARQVRVPLLTPEPLDPDCLLSAHLDEGVSYHLQGRLEQAEQAYRMAVHLATDTFQINNRIIAEVNLGELLLDRGDADRARPHLRNATQAAANSSRLRSYALALLAEAELVEEPGPQALALAAEAESILLEALHMDSSMQAALDRLRSALLHVRLRP